MKKITLEELRERKDWKCAVIVFKKESYERMYSEKERSYQINSNAKYFDNRMCGNSLFGDCLDGKDNGVRLDVYMHLLPSEGKAWIVDYCYITE